jgi:hypothetical protein
MKRLFTCIFIISIAISVFAQRKVDNTEHIYFNTDRDIYHVGEAIHFSTWYTSSESNWQSKVAYVEIYNKSNKAFIQKVFNIQESPSSQVIELPEDIPSGIYKIRIYTNYQKNFPPEIWFKKAILIINEDTPLRIEVDSAHTLFPAPLELINVSGLAPKYNTRESIDFQVEITSHTYKNISLSIIPKSTLLLEEDTHKPVTINTQEFTVRNLPETRDLTISAYLRPLNPERKSLNKIVYLSILGERDQFHVIRANENGKFTFTINSPEEENTVYLCCEDEEFEIIPGNNFSTQFAMDTCWDFHINHQHIKAINDMYYHHQINEAYGTITHTTKDIQEIFNTNLTDPDDVIFLDDYIKFNTLEEVFSEIVPLVHVRKKGDKKKLYVFNEIKKSMIKTPLILLDNLAITNIDKLLEINPGVIHRISIINQEYIHGDFSFSAIIKIDTKTDNFASYSFGTNSAFIDYVGSKPSSHFFESEKSIEADKSGRKAIFSNTLHWIPTLKEGQNEVHFQTSDARMKYQVILQGTKQVRKGKLTIDGKVYENLTGEEPFKLIIGEFRVE